MPSPVISSAVENAVAAFSPPIRSFFSNYRDDALAGNFALVEAVQPASTRATATINALAADLDHGAALRTALAGTASNITNLILAVTEEFPRAEALANLTTLDAALNAVRATLIANAGQDDALAGSIPAPSAFFGDGSDGNVTITTATQTIAGLMTSGVLIRDAFFNNLTISGAGRLNTGGFRVYVRGVLDLRSAQTNAINRLGNNGNNATSATGAAASVVLSPAHLGGAPVSGAGGSGAVTNGSNGAATAAQTLNGGSAATGGAASGATGGLGELTGLSI